MTILITGGGGFIGSHVADRLVQDYSTVIVDNFSTGNNENTTDFFDAGGEIVVADILDRDTLFDIFYQYKPERVVHLAAQSAVVPSFGDPITDLRINALGTIYMMEACNRFGVKKLVFSSTSSVYREKGAPRKMREGWDRYPSSPYGASKLTAEHYIRQMFAESVILRFGNVYGPRQVSLGGNQLIAMVMNYLTNRKEYIEFKVHGNGEQTRDYIYVGDVVDVIVRCLFTDNLRATFNVASGKPTSVNRILLEIEKLFGIAGYQWEHTDVQDIRQNVCLDISYIKKVLSWKPKWSIARGLKATADWWLERNGHV